MAFDVVQNPAHGVWENNTTHCQNVTGNDSFSGCIIYIFGADICHTAIIRSLGGNEIIRKQIPHKIKTRVANSLL